MQATTLARIQASPAAADLQVAGDGAPDASVRAALNAEARRYAAMARGDVGGLERLLAGDLTYTHANGLTQDRDEYLAFLRSGKVRYLGLDVEIHSAKRVGDAVVLTGLLAAQAVIAGATRPLANLFTNVLVADGADWRLTAWQSTPAPQPA